jgi:hypothetical protein
MKRIMVVLAVLLVAAAAAFAQTSDSHLINFNLTASALIDLNDAADWDIALALSALPADAGLPPTGGPYTTTRYLWYTVLSGGSAALIQASLDSDLPAGLSLQLVANVSAAGAGTRGAGQTIAAVDSTARSLVTGIGSCYTTRGATDGAAVAYTADMSGYTGTSIVRTLTYTISGW